MGEFNVTCHCYVDEDLLKTKTVNAIVRNVRDSVKSDIEGIVRDEVRKCFEKIDIERIVLSEFNKNVKEEVSDLVYKIRRDDFKKFYYNAKECDPTPEKLYKLLASYVGYIDLLNDELFKASVADKVTTEIMTKLGKNHSYAAIAKTVETMLDESSRKE